MGTTLYWSLVAAALTFTAGMVVLLWDFVDCSLRIRRVNNQK